MHRRLFLANVLAGTSCLSAGAFRNVFASNAAPRADIEEIKVISWKPPLYHGWPTLFRRKSGELFVVFSGGRESHVCPFGRMEVMQSKDGGRNWSWPRVLYDGPIDDRDAGGVETASGSLLITNFTSLAYEPSFQAAIKKPAGSPGAWDELKLREWTAVHSRLTDEDRKKELGSWMWRSTDGGITWSVRYAAPVNSPHGPILLRNGNLFYCGVELWTSERAIRACLSTDDGVTWNSLSTIPVHPDHQAKDYHELHAVEAADGTLIVHIRNHSKPNQGETLQTESRDGGRTWTTPHSIGVWGLPSHLLRLNDGRLLMTYGHRRSPLGNQARVSADHGVTWSEPIILSADGVSGDLGYPSTVECDDGGLVTVWYELLAGSPNAQLRQARWRLK